MRELVADDDDIQVSGTFYFSAKTSNITKNTKENNEKCLGSQIKKIEICIGE